MNNTLLKIENLYVQVADLPEKKIIKGLDLTINNGEIHAVMGPNGTGKSTLSYVLTGKADYEVTEGNITFKDKNLLQLAPDERANEGIFLSMQSPIAIPGVSANSFLKHAVNAKRKYQNLPELDAAEFLKLLRPLAQRFEVSAEMLKRDLNVGFSGGERKRMEILQLALLQPKLAILDEADSGLDIDALRLVSEGIKQWHNQDNALLIITHRIELLNYLQPDYVHINIDGKIVKTGGMELALELEKSGYKEYMGSK